MLCMSRRNSVVEPCELVEIPSIEGPHRKYENFSGPRHEFGRTEVIVISYIQSTIFGQDGVLE